MKSCCLTSAKRYLKKNRDVATCDGCGFLLLAYTQQRDFEEAIKALKGWGGEYFSATEGRLHIVAKARPARKRV